MDQIISLSSNSGASTLRNKKLNSIEAIYCMLFMALGKPLGGWVLCAGRQAVFFIPIILLLPKFMGLNGVIVAQPIADIITIIIMGILAVKLNGEIKQFANAQVSNVNLNVMDK